MNIHILFAFIHIHTFHSSLSQHCLDHYNGSRINDFKINHWYVYIQKENIYSLVVEQSPQRWGKHVQTLLIEGRRKGEQAYNEYDTYKLTIQIYNKMEHGISSEWAHYPLLWATVITFIQCTLQKCSFTG